LNRISFADFQFPISRAVIQWTLRRICTTAKAYQPKF
jgi:hypothetical protein